MRTKILATAMTLGVLACDDPSADAILTMEPDAGVEPSAEPWVSARETESKPQPGAELDSIELTEQADRLTLYARDAGGAELGVMVLEKVKPDPGQSNFEVKWFPLEASGYFDVTGLSEEEVDNRVQAIADEIAWHPVESIVGCAVRVAAAAALCMDGPAVILSCPVGLHGVMCHCGPEVGIPKYRLAKICD